VITLDVSVVLAILREAASRGPSALADILVIGHCRHVSRVKDARTLIRFVDATAPKQLIRAVVHLTVV